MRGFFGLSNGSFVSDPPQFVGPEGDIRRAVLVGADITLVCGANIVGNPTPIISWTDNNVVIISDGNGISGSTTLSLTIASVTRDQAGNWTCTVANSLGSIRHLISLTVVGECVCVLTSEITSST